MDAARGFRCEFSSVAWVFFEDGARQGCNFHGNRVCPRIAEAEFRSSFFGGEFRWRFNGGARWITQLTGAFPVGMVDAPKFLARLRSHGRTHVGSSPQAGFAKMYQRHKMREQ